MKAATRHQTKERRAKCLAFDQVIPLPLGLEGVAGHSALRIARWTGFGMVLRLELQLGYGAAGIAIRCVARLCLVNAHRAAKKPVIEDDQTEPNKRDGQTYAQAHCPGLEAQCRLPGRLDRSKSYTVSDAIEDYFTQLDHEGKHTADARNRAKVHILPKLGSTAVARLTPSDLRSWLKEMADAPPRVRSSPGAVTPAFRKTTNRDERPRRSSANRTLTVLKAALNRAWREGRVHDDKAWRSVKPFASVEAARARYLEIDEAQRLLSACEPGFYELVQAALQTGCRYGELRQLLVYDFNADAGTITVRHSKSGKIRHAVLTDEGIVFFSSLCADRSGDELMMPNLKRLRRSVRIRGQHRRFGKITGEKPPPVDDDGRWRPSEQVRAMMTACERANILPPANFHALRHTWASHSIMAGVPLVIVARNLGHADTLMVERHYGHLAPSYVADAIRRGAPKFGLLDTPNVKHNQCAISVPQAGQEQQLTGSPEAAIS
jgi:integrase